MRIFIKIQQIIPIPSCCVPFNHFIRRDMSKYYAVYFVGDNQANNRVRIESSRTSNRGAFLDSFAALMTNSLGCIKALMCLIIKYVLTVFYYSYVSNWYRGVVRCAFVLCISCRCSKMKPALNVIYLCC